MDHRDKQDWVTHLVLDEKFNSLDGSSSGLGDPGSHSGEHEVLGKSQLLARHGAELGRVVVPLKLVPRTEKCPDNYYPVADWKENPRHT